MLLKFQVANHRSIRGQAEISFAATPLKEQAASLAPCRYTKHGVLPVLALYGANASGKSNLLDALAFFQRMIQRSFVDGDSGSGMPQQPFLLDETSRREPSTYIADFILAGVRYQYGFAISRERVLEEWLYQFPKVARQILFHRKAGETPEFFFGRGLKGKNREVEAITRGNALFLSAAAKAEHASLAPVAAYFAENISFLVNAPIQMAEQSLGQRLEQNADLINRVSRYLTAADTGIVGLAVEKEPLSNTRNIINNAMSEALKGIGHEALAQALKELDHDLKLVFTHQAENGKTCDLRFEEESLGTRYLLTILVPMLGILEKGALLMLDEITTNLHTLLARKLVTLFMDPAINTKGAQLLFTTHDTNLLAPGLLRRDQIWFAEKSARTGETAVYPLSDIKTKNTDNIERGYLQGRFGGIPFIPDNQPLC